MDRPFVANFAIMEIFSKQLWYKNLVLDHTLENTASIVTEQIKAQPCGAITHDPVISVVGNRFLFTGFQPQWGELRALLFRALFSQKTQHFPCPHQAISQNYAQKFPISLSVLKLDAQMDLHPLVSEQTWGGEGWTIYCYQKDPPIFLQGFPSLLVHFARHQRKDIS